MSVTARSPAPLSTRLFRRLAPLVLLLMAACMPGNEHSVIDRPAANDDRMVGAWVAHLGDGDLIVARITADTPEMLLVDLGVFTDEPGFARYRAARTRIGDRYILELTEIDASAQGGSGAALGLPARFIVGYAFDGTGRLVVNIQNDLDTALEKAVKAGTLTGRTDARGRGQTVIVTASTKDLRGFIAATPDIFGTPPIVYSKLVPPAQK
jgi:hypothetical protein